MSYDDHYWKDIVKPRLLIGGVIVITLAVLYFLKIIG